MPRDFLIESNPSKLHNIWEGIKSIPGHAANAAAHPLSSLQDFGAGAAGGIQRAGASMGELGQYLSENLNPLSPLRKYVPESMKIERPNIRELAGLGEENPLKLEEALASSNNNPLAKALGQGFGGVALGGRSLPGQIASNAGWGAIQAEPGQRLEEGLIGGALVGIPGALFKAPGAIRSASQYMQPGKAAEAFRSALGEGTSAQNIETLSKRAQFAKQSAKEEALIPKRELEATVGEKNLYEVPKEKLSGKNAPKDVDTFLKAKRGSNYFNNKEVTAFYNKNGNLMELHKAFEQNPTYGNYDALQSALKKEQRTLNARLKNKTITDLGEEKLNQISKNIDNLEKDHQAFMETLPEKMQNLNTEFRKKYKSYAETYEKGAPRKGASETLRDLAEGRNSLINDEAVVKLFSHPTAADKKAILDMGEGAAKNAMYAALQKVRMGDAGKMAETILDLKRTKGFDKIITKDMEEWATNMLAHTKNVGRIKNALSASGGAVAGGMLAGPVGAAIGAALPFGVKYGKNFIKKAPK
jgi:hypothetical protein